MEEAKPKRKYVMTPEHRAKVIANLGKARQAPKEKVYRKTEKRYRANVNNLGIANAKRRQEAEQEAETLRSKMESLFPAPEVPSFTRGISSTRHLPCPHTRTHSKRPPG